MLKAVKECMKNWLVTHERLYWYIVVGLAVLAFGIITALGCAKLEKANAAVEFSVNAPEINYDTLPTFQQVVDAVVDTFGVQPSEVTAENTVMLTSDGNLYVVFYGADIAKLECYGLANGCNINAKSAVTRISINVDTDTVTSSTFNGSFMGIYNTRNEYQGYVWGAPIYCWERNGTMPILTPVTDYPKGAEYSPDAPYVKFDKLNVKNDIAADNGKFFESLNYYDNFIVPAYWEYVGYMQNYKNYPGAEYLLEVDFTVELPRLEYIQSIANKLDIDIQWTYNMVKWGSDLIDLWNKDALALKNTYQFKYTFPVVPDDNGKFSFRLSYPEIQNLIAYFSESARNEFNSYDSETLGILFSFLHVDSCCISVKTTASETVLYGKSTINHFERGVHDVCVEMEVDLDILNKSEEEIDKIIQDSISAGYEQYYKELEDRINSLEGQLGDVSNIQSGFAGNLETTDLWSGFTGLVQGLGGIAPAVYGLSSLTGVVLAFMPIEINGIMSFTLLALCVIAIIKAIRG